ncbi:MAG: hypothetical protein M3421_14410, partial [Bacteroidota bacterium]|nr:hypothetical protein [Bacteroidota bacterium]
VVHAAGHEHALQYFLKNNVHHVVSGSGTKTSSMKKHNDADFAVSIKGFARIAYYENSETWLEFWIPGGNENQGKIIFKEKLYGGEQESK